MSDKLTVALLSWGVIFLWLSTYPGGEVPLRAKASVGLAGLALLMGATVNWVLS